MKESGWKKNLGGFFPFKSTRSIVRVVKPFNYTAKNQPNLKTREYFLCIGLVVSVFSCIDLFN